MWETKKEEYGQSEAKKANIEGGDMESTERRMNARDGELARHKTECQSTIHVEHGKIVRKEQNTV